MDPMKIGVIGCGNISGIYLQNGRMLEAIEIAAVADLDADRARAQADKYDVPRVCSPDELLADEQIQMVLNLTPPPAHAAVARAAIQAGKHVYNEKPLTVTVEEGRDLLALARDKGVRVGCAPDTFLGAGLQTCRRLIESGAIGRPVAATAFMTCHGHESWHPDPEFYYKPGGGPMLDMGPYYLTALVHLVGPIEAVTGCSAVTFPQRTIGSAPKKGQVIDVEVATHVVGAMQFANGAIGNIITSFDIWGANLPRIEIYGTEGSLSVPDPNTFGGTVKLLEAGNKEWVEQELTGPYAENSRGVGPADMAAAIASGRPHRASGELAFHVLEAMHGIIDAGSERKFIEMTTQPAQPAPLPAGLQQGQVEP
ncbi:MAG: Gfo/Idh/MocA family protein [Phycisphaerae bacterium]